MKHEGSGKRGEGGRLNTSLSPLPTALFPHPILDKWPLVKISLDCPSCIRVVGCSGRPGAEALLPSLAFGWNNWEISVEKLFPRRGVGRSSGCGSRAGAAGHGSVARQVAGGTRGRRQGWEGARAARQAMRDLETAHAADLPAILSALDKASPLGANWIRNAFESVADREVRQKHPLPVGARGVRPRQVASASGAAVGV